ncbi:MAG: hypothetical protein J6P84_03235 [Alphaproteobacteria bacterium]|nr:hypothetical protein [Alphaproteobacteria bacterium]MBO7642367.1 hypothetical protein [Alphaproteobacteria bacterium]
MSSSSQLQQPQLLRDLAYKDNAKDQSVEMQTIWNLPINAEISEIREKLEPCLRFVEEDVSNLDRLDDVAGRCHLFSNKLISIAEKAMTDQRREDVNALILSMSARILEATRKVRNASIKTSWTADVPWLTVLYNDNRLHILNIMNLIAYDDDYDSHEAVEYELTNIVTRLNEVVDPDIYINTVKEIEYDNKHLVIKFHEKLQKVGVYGVKHSGPVRKFLNEIERQVIELKKKKRRF